MLFALAASLEPQPHVERHQEHSESVDGILANLL